MEISNQDRVKLIHFLNFVCDYEASKPIEEMDEELINACVKVLLELQDKHVNHSPEFIDEQVRKIFQKGEKETTVPEAVKTNKKQINKTKVWLVAACIAILVALFSIISVANDWNVFDFLSEKFGSVHSAPIEQEQEFNGITVISRGKNTNYETIEKALETEKIDILYPTFLPDDIEITKIMFYKKEFVDKVMYKFNSEHTTFIMTFNSEIDNELESFSNKTIYINNRKCYVCEMDDVSCVQIYFEYNGNLCMFSHPDKNELIKIIENLEEINYEN